VKPVVGSLVVSIPLCMVVEGRIEHSWISSRVRACSSDTYRSVERGAVDVASEECLNCLQCGYWVDP